MYTSTGPSSSLSLATPLLDGAPHVLPPPTSLAVHFIKRLLPPAVDPLHRNAPQDSDTPQELQDNIHSSDMDSSGECPHINQGFMQGVGNWDPSPNSPPENKAKSSNNISGYPGEEGCPCSLMHK